MGSYWQTTDSALLVFAAALLAVICANAQFHEYDDEWDNILGGLRIAEGAVLYRDYFSHHFPLPYFISGFFHLFIQPNFIVFRLLWGSVLFLALLAIVLRFGRSSLILPVVPTVSTVAIIAPAAWMHMLVAESIIALLVLVGWLYLFEKRETPLKTLDLVVLGAIPSLIVLCSIGYLFLAVTLGIAALVITAREQRAILKRSWTILALAALLPLLLVGGYLAAAGALKDAYWQAVTFNQIYYFPFTGNTPADPVGALLFVIRGVLVETTKTFALLGATTPWWVWVYSAMIVSFVTFCLWQRRGGVLVILGALIGFFSLSRYSPTFDFANNRNVVFYPLAISCGWALLSCLITRMRTARLIGSPVTWSIFLALAAGWGWFLRPQLEPRINNVDRIATFFNANLPSNEQYWIGPFRFRSQYFIRAGEPASRYAFFLPWHAGAEVIVEELLADFERRRPPYIAFDRNFSIWGHPIKRYSRDFVRYIDRNYERIPNSLSEGGLSLWRRRRSS